jgi:hypothetical protein
MSTQSPDVTQPDAYWEEAHAAFHRVAAEDARIWTAVEPEPLPDGAGRDLALQCEAQAELEAEPW